jgi:hypothetical protein
MQKAETTVQLTDPTSLEEAVSVVHGFSEFDNKQGNR